MPEGFSSRPAGYKGSRKICVEKYHIFDTNEDEYSVVILDDTEGGLSKRTVLCTCKDQATAQLIALRLGNG